MSAVFLVRKGAHYLQGESGWGERSCATAFPQAKAERIAADWTKGLALPPDRCVAEPCDSDKESGPEQGELFR
jgi:hypothetical protein